MFVLKLSSIQILLRQYYPIPKLFWIEFSNCKASLFVLCQLIVHTTVNENNIGAPKIQNNFYAFIFFIFPILHSTFLLHL